MISAAAIAVMSAVDMIQCDVRVKVNTRTQSLERLRRTIIIRRRDFNEISAAGTKTKVFIILPKDTRQEE